PAPAEQAVPAPAEKSGRRRVAKSGRRRVEKPVRAPVQERARVAAQPADLEESAQDGDRDPEAGPVVEAADELPAGTRRVSALQHKPGTRRLVRRRGSPRVPGRRHSRRGRVAGVLAIVVAAALIWFLVQLFQPFQGAGHGSVTVTIPAKSGVGQVGDLLQHDGVIVSSFFFGLRATLAGERSSLLPGTYHLKLGMPYGKVLSVLTTPPPAAKVTALTLTEGRTRRQIDVLLRHQGVSGSYATASRHSRFLDPTGYGAPRSTASLEGFLFPSTYQLREPISVGALVADQLKQFRKVFAGVNLADARRHHRTPYDVLIVASMVEGETPTAHDRPLIASVIYNRLRDGMPLQLDSTVRYAVGNYTTPITQSQLSSRSPWNTYAHKGLPPTPIDNPGLASIQAASHPASTNYLFFVAKPCGNGASLFASTYAQFQADTNRYEAARAKRGGRSPVHC
ncbi:MAG: endolytic transglycosylase MltG, partial [Actinomycetota bacterium]|nr:endolytic transglycosylase MltG [Actinomycetota bacterium]